MSPLLFSVDFFLGLIGITCSENFYVAAPATFRLNADETIAVVVEGPDHVVVDVYIQDHPGYIKNITRKMLTVNPEEPQVLKFLLNPEDFPPYFLNSPGSPKRVSVTAVTEKFRKEIIVPITIESGYIFIQMDKAIYTPDERVLIRIISLNEDVVPSDKIFKLQISNPDGNIVKEELFINKDWRLWKPFKSYIYRFPSYPVLGEWSATVRYGYEFQQSSTVNFELNENVLSTFTIDVHTPNAILPTTKAFKIGVTAQHVHGREVQGVVRFRIGVKSDASTDITFFSTSLRPNELYYGFFEETIMTVTLKNHEDIGWFPDIEGSHLVVEATVVDYATGNKEMSTNTKTRFSKSPFIISFKPCLSYFIPGRFSIFEAYITYVNGSVAAGIPVTMKAKADGKMMDFKKMCADSDGDGKVAFEIQTEWSHSTISVRLETADPNYYGSQAVGYFNQIKFQSRSRAYLAIGRRVDVNRLQPGYKFWRPIYSAGVENVYYMIVSKGKIIGIHKVFSSIVKRKSVLFQITYEMIPSFRLLVFAHCRDEFIADSLKVDVERVCDPNAQVSLEREFKYTKPGASAVMNISGTPGTWVGLLGVDEAVYALSKDNLLTKTKMFDKFASHDLGCDPRGGISVDHVLGYSGITIVTNKYTPTVEHTCVQTKRKRREAENVIGKEPFGQLEGDNSFSKLQYISADKDDAILSRTLVRSNFRKTWIFEDLKIRSEGKRSLEVVLPHSITTRVISAFSVTEKNGMCVAEPQKIVSFKNIFLHLNLPYSVVRNAQIEVQATVFNYGSTLLPATVYMYGIKDVCTSPKQGQKSERKRLVVKPNSAESVTFPVVPLKTGIFKIKVVVLAGRESDVIERYLRVVPEGITKEVDISIHLDPSNQQGRTKRDANTKDYPDTIDPSQNLQKTVIKLDVPEEFVPGSASVSIAALGDPLGHVVETAINNTDSLLLKPHGCAEQNIMFLAQTLYTMIYLKVTGKSTASTEAKCYEFIRTGYVNQLAFRKNDGSYSSCQRKSKSTWLTAFVTKVFCQASKVFHINKYVMCSGIKWLLKNQRQDGSYGEKNPIHFIEMMGGVQGKPSITAFVLIVLQECKCDEENLIRVKKRAVSFMKNHIINVRKPLHAAIMAYALALSDNELKYAANDKLLSFAKRNEDENLMFWETKNSAQDIQTAGYGLLTQLLLNDMTTSAFIVNWLNTKQLQSGSFISTQDTVVALQSLSEYVIRAQMPAINLVSSITLSNDEHFHKVLAIHEDNALVLQEVKIDKIGGTLFINTVGHGVGSMVVKLRYNVLVPPEEICEFDVKVKLSKQNEKDCKKRVIRNIGSNGTQDHAVFDRDETDCTRSVAKASVKSRIRRQNGVRNCTLEYIISICVKYLGNKAVKMSIVDVGIFSGFKPDVNELKKLEEDPNHLIQWYERSSRGVVFYLKRIPTARYYCFSFPIVREYLAGNIQMKVVKVYDYYNPAHTCTKFYSPDTNSPILHTICEHGTCICAEGECPNEDILADTASLVVDQRMKKLKDMACNNYDYVWKGKLSGPIKNEGRYLYIPFTVQEVIKEGIDKKDFVEGKSRTLIYPANCKSMSPNQTYMIMSKDGQTYYDTEGVKCYQYLLDHMSVVHRWTSVADAKDCDLQLALNWMADDVSQKGCS